MDKQLITAAAVKQVIRDYWQQYKTHPWLTAGAFLLPAVGTLFVFFVPPLIVARLVDLFTTRGDISLQGVGSFVLLFGGFWILGEVMWRVGTYFMNKLRAVSINNLSRTAFQRLAQKDYTFYTNNFVGSLTKKGLSFSSHFDSVANILSYSVVGNIIQIVFASIVLWKYSSLVPLILIASIMIAVFIAIPIIRRRARLVTIRHEMSSKGAGRFSDAVTNMLTIKSFARERYEYDTYGTYVDNFTTASRKAADYQNFYLDTALSPLYVGTNVLGLVVAIFFADTLGLQTGAIIVIFSYYSLVTRMFWDINSVYRSMESAITEAAEFTQLFVEPPAVLDVPGALALYDENASMRFENVDFDYAGNGASDSFLKRFNLEIKNKEKVGLVGPSGGGKTTITKLLLRFINLRSGAITIGSQDISKVTQESLREMIAYVPQEPLLFHRSLYENISYGNPSASEEEVRQAAKLAHADEFIEKLPQGYQTLVGERGIKLSGGQRQRVAIARAILKNAPILVLDEATSSLDSESEKYIQEGLWELMKDKTTLVIAHRLSTIKHLDRIIVLDKGRIVQDGAHDDLIKQKGLYAKLWGHQSGEFLEE